MGKYCNPFFGIHEPRLKSDKRCRVDEVADLSLAAEERNYEEIRHHRIGGYGVPLKLSTMKLRFSFSVEGYF
jgi:hypothetical protein